MKMILNCLAAVIILAALLFAAQPLLAGDSGDENVVPVWDWKCINCDYKCKTFATDDLGGKSRLEYGDLKYQQSNWFMLHDKSRAIQKCNRNSKEGEHYFERTKEYNESPWNIGRYLFHFVVLKNGGNIKAKMIQFKCIKACGFTGSAFLGDDLDMHGAIWMSTRNNVYMLYNMGKVNTCTTYDSTFHLLFRPDKSTREIKSYAIAENLQKIFVSN